MHFKKLNATQLAEIIDVQRSSVSHVLNGRNKPSLEFVQRLVNEFPEVSFEWLVNGSGSLREKDTNVSDRGTGETVVDVTKVPTSETNVHSTTQEKENVSEGSFPTFTNNHTQPADLKSVNEIKKIVVFYSNGTFEEYFPK
jgi:plasmid maintenance system antidote protein VapI